jgi:hypothetical protein
MIPLFVLPFTLLVLFASSTSGDKRFCEIVTLCRPPPHQDWGRARTAVNRFAGDDKEPGPSWGEQLPGEQPRETARPSRHVRRKGAAPLSGAEEQNVRAISARAQCACLLSLKMGCITRLDKTSLLLILLSNTHCAIFDRTCLGITGAVCSGRTEAS